MKLVVRRRLKGRVSRIKHSKAAWKLLPCTWLGSWTGTRAAEPNITEGNSLWSGICRLKMLSGVEKTPACHNMKLVLSRVTSDLQVTKSNGYFKSLVRLTSSQHSTLATVPVTVSPCGFYDPTLSSLSFSISSWYSASFTGISFMLLKHCHFCSRAYSLFSPHLFARHLIYSPDSQKASDSNMSPEMSHW